MEPLVPIPWGLRRFALRGLWMAGLLLGASGCTNPFSPARPEPPAAGGVLEDYTNPPRVLATIAAAIEDKGARNGQSAYVNALADSTGLTTRAFYAFARSAVITRWEQGSGGRAAPERWDINLERNFYLYLPRLRPLDSYRWEWSDDEGSGSDETDDINGTALLHRRYQLFAISPDQLTTTVLAVGFADLYFQRVSSSRWALYRWEDRFDPDIGVNPVDEEQLSMGARRLESQ